MGSILGFVVLWGTQVCWDCLRISSAFPASICAIRVLIALVRLVLLVRLASEVWKSILSRERKSFQARTCCWGPVSSVATLATRSRNLATAGLTCTGTYLIVVVLCSLVPFHFVECPEFRFQGHVLGHTILDLGLWDWIAGFDLLLVVNVTHQAVPLDLRNVLPSRDSSEFVWSEATASEVHHSRSFGSLPCSSFSGCDSVPTSEARSTVRILRNGDAVGCEVSRNRGVM